MISWLQHRWTGLHLLILALASLILYMYGLFPIKYHTGNMAHWDDLPRSIGGISIDPDEVYKPVETSVIIMIIDALRYDYVTEEYMPFTAEIIKNKSACIYISVTNTPTVTLARIKAMMTGGPSTFIDIALNLGAPAVLGDSVLRVASTRRRKTVLYGDKTWLLLFPGLWSEYDVTYGFFMTEFTIVDTNVTRHLDEILTPDKNKKPPFDFLVLHYLGLDRIGHLEGARSPKVKPKLLEMDDAVRRVFTAMSTWERDTVFFMGGDHGMKDAGSHGGASPAEIYVPLVIAKSGNFQGPHFEHENTTVAQVDLTPTVSWLLGAPIPGDNTGRILPCLLPRDLRQHLYLLHYVAKQNAKAVFAQIGNIALKKEFHKRLKKAEQLFALFLTNKRIGAAKTAKELYEESLTEMSTYLTESSINFDMFSIFTGICLTFAIAAALICVTLFSLQPEDGKKYSVTYHDQRRSLLGTILAFTIVASTTTAVLFILCVFSETKSSLCSITPPWVGVFGAVVLTFTITFFIVKTAIQYSMDLTFMNEWNAIDLFLICATLFYTWTFFGTSNIQEEHMTWYYYWNTWMIFILIRTSGIVIEYLNKRSQGATAVRDKPPLKMTKGLTVLPKWVMLIVLHRYLRSINQTGDRWLFLSDTSDWLNKTEHSFFLQAHLLVGIILTFIICIWNLRYTENIRKLNTIFTILAILCIICYRIASQELVTPFDSIKTWDTVNIVNVLWGILTTQMVVEVLSHAGAFRKCGVRVIITNPNKSELKNYDDLYNVPEEKTEEYFFDSDNAKLSLARSVSHLVLNNTMLVVLLLMRPHNVILIPSLYVTCVLTSQCLDHNLWDMKQSKRQEVLDSLRHCLIHFWIGCLFFFYQGNSNNLATVDLGTGYVGLRTYCLFRVAARLELHTYAGPALAIIILFTNKAAASESWEQYVKSVWRYTNILAMQRVYNLAFYLIIAIKFRYHLYIWIAFSPKLVYELGATVFTVAVLVTIAEIIVVSYVASCITRIVIMKTKL